MTYPGANTYPGASTYPASSPSGRVQVYEDPVNSPPRTLLSLSGFQGSNITVYRVDMAGNATVVRSANNVLLNGGGWVGYDYESPYNAPVLYRGVSDSNDMDQSQYVALPVSQPWLVHPGIPALSLPLLIQSIGPKTRTTNSGVHTVLGRRTPVVITDGVRRAPSYDVTVGTQSLDDETALLALLDDSSPLLLQVVYNVTDRVIYDWVSVGDLVETPMVEWFGNLFEAWTLPCTVVTSPAGSLQSQRTWNDVYQQFSNWGIVRDQYATWRDVILDNEAG